MKNSLQTRNNHNHYSTITYLVVLFSNNYSLERYLLALVGGFQCVKYVCICKRGFLVKLWQYDSSGTSTFWIFPSWFWKTVLVQLTYDKNASIILEYTVFSCYNTLRYNMDSDITISWYHGSYFYKVIYDAFFHITLFLLYNH